SPGFSGDGGPAAAALLSSPITVAVGPEGQVVIADVANHRVRAVAAASPPRAPPAAPRTLNATAVPPSGAHLTWPGSWGASGYEVLRRISGSFAAIGTVSSTSFDEAGLTSGHTYAYVVRALNASGSSASSPVA